MGRMWFLADALCGDACCDENLFKRSFLVTSTLAFLTLAELVKSCFLISRSSLAVGDVTVTFVAFIIEFAPSLRTEPELFVVKSNCPLWPSRYEPMRGRIGLPELLRSLFILLAAEIFGMTTVSLL